MARASLSSLVGSSHASHADGARMSGMRSWIGAIVSFGSVVIIVPVLVVVLVSPAVLEITANGMWSITPA